MTNKTDLYVEVKGRVKSLARGRENGYDKKKLVTLAIEQDNGEVKSVSFPIRTSSEIGLIPYRGIFVGQRMG